MFLRSPITKIAQSVSLRYKKKAARPKTRKIFKRFLFFNQMMDFEIIKQEFFLHDNYPNFSNRTALLNRMAISAINRKTKFKKDYFWTAQQIF